MAISIYNFSLDYKEWKYLDNLAFLAVSVIETSSGSSLVSSGTYFIKDGIKVATSLSGITNGYRCYYNNPDLVSSGVINLTIRAESTSGEIKTNTYKLLFGYNLLFDELIDWGPSTKVTTTVIASNDVVCSNTESESFYFKTKDFESTALSASIRPVGFKNLSAVVYPQNDFFFYGHTYTITVSGVRDYDGNEMAPFSFTFKTENPI